MLAVGLLILSLWDDPPPARDLYNFPPPAVALEQKQALDAYRGFLADRRAFAEGLMDLAPWLYFECVRELYHLDAALREAHHVYNAWDWLHWAHTRDTELEARQSLSRLRVLLGPEAYYSGLMPRPPFCARKSTEHPP